MRMNRLKSSSVVVEDLIQLQSNQSRHSINGGIQSINNHHNHHHNSKNHNTDPAGQQQNGFHLEDYIYELQKRNLSNGCGHPSEQESRVTIEEDSTLSSSSPSSSSSISTSTLLSSSSSNRTIMTTTSNNNSHSITNGHHQSHHNSQCDLSQLTTVDELRTLLCQKEKDLILAAELGKALLERNEDLTRANERITEEYSHKLEILEQEKHGLRRKLDNLEGEYENRIAELQADLAELRKDLSEKQSQVRQTEKEKADLIKELMEQNHRLVAELKQASESEDQLSDQLQSLREQFNARRSNLNDHVAQVEGLQEEINILSKRKSDLEKRISALRQEREHLSMSLEESSDRIFLLERRSQEQENQIHVLQSELDEARQANSRLQNRLDNVLRKHAESAFNGGHHTGAGQTHKSLFNEIEMLSMDEELLNGNGQTQAMDQGVDNDDLNSPEYICRFRQELVEVYHQLRRICSDLSRRKENSGSFNSAQEDSGVPATPEEIQISQIRIGMLNSILKEIQIHLKDILGDNYDGPCGSCKALLDERLELQKLRKEAVEQGEELKRKRDEVHELTTKLTVFGTELTAIKEERDNLKESLNSSGLGKDEIVKRAWELRDQSVARKNTVEIELAKTRIECMHVNSQLMEAIQQKIELSQQLEQWQMDMQNLLDEQLKKKLTTQEQEDKRKRQLNSTPKLTTDASSPLSSANSRSKLLRLWRREVKS